MDTIPETLVVSVVSVKREKADPVTEERYEMTIVRGSLCRSNITDVAIIRLSDFLIIYSFDDKDILHVTAHLFSKSNYILSRRQI
jgi:hypothetical protein